MRIFIAVAEREHVTRAAQVLNITQSAASAAIAALEAQHGVRLFDRVGRGIVLTDAGRLLLDEARAVLARAADAERALAEHGGLKRGTLRLVASQTIAGYWLPERLARFHTRYPGIELCVGIANSEGAARSVAAGEADLGFIEGNLEAPELVHRVVGTDRLQLVAAAPVATVDNDWLARTPWIMREPGSGTRARFEEALAARGIDPRTLPIALTLPSNEAVLSAVRAGAGAAVLSRLVVAPALAMRALFALPLDLPERPFYALRHPERHRSKAAEALLMLIEDYDRHGDWVI